MANSAAEEVMSDLVTLVSGITVGNGYRNTLQAVDTQLKRLEQVPAFPAATVIFNEGAVEAINTAKTTFSEYIEVWIIGYVQGDEVTISQNSSAAAAGETLLHDLKKCISQNVTAQISGTPRYIISRYNPVFRILRLLPTGEREGTVGLGFQIKILTESSDFT